MLAFLLACAGPASPDDTACDGTSGTLHACVTISGAPQANAHVGFRETDEDEWTDALTGEDGCVDIGLVAGEWQVRGDDVSQSCTSAPESVTISACEVAERAFEVADWCVDG